MLRASPYDREIAALAIPALATLVAEPLYVLADTAVVGRLGTEELAGLAVASSVLLLINAVFVFLAYGTTGTVAWYGPGHVEFSDEISEADQQRFRNALHHQIFHSDGEGRRKG